MRGAGVAARRQAFRRTALGLSLWAVAVLLNGCAGLWGGGPPSWVVSGTSKEFPPEQFLTGIGQADNRQEAADRAYAAVARVFKSEVTAQAKDWESYLQFENRGTTTTERRVTLDHFATISTDKVLESVRELSAWRDDKTGQFYILAGMNRAQGAAVVQAKMGELDDAVDTKVREARQSADKLIKLRSLRRAIKDLVLRETYNADLRIIRASGQGSAASYRVPELTAELEQFLAKQVTIGVVVSGLQAEPVRRAVIEGLLREGLPVLDRLPEPAPAGAASAEDRPLELIVKGTVRIWGTNVSDPRFRFARWCSDFVVLEADRQRVVGAVSRSGREGHLTEGEAAAKALRVMQQEVTTELSKTLAGYIAGDTEPPNQLPPAACPRGEG